ncbi:TIR domain-containing protein [Alkalicoccus saliphilus]|uniref:Molecular chaperone Tir n=1 Tax=Alkalicoccus saliphilus TaxID=200989 RepID=A0A2T4U6W6_9BACI|nr:TIR domain-containing protein [Alkalicoccus saliphilus]PTL39138.1 molecular chaperone Tir [Alkalicoccus saliphilus]
MPNVVFFGFKELDRETVLTIKGRAVNSRYANLNFRVRDLLKRWDTTDRSVIRQAISKKLTGTSRTIVFVGEETHKSYWVPQEVQMTLDAEKPVYAMRISGTKGKIPDILTSNGIHVYEWSEAKLQELATR